MSPNGNQLGLEKTAGGVGASPLNWRAVDLIGVARWLVWDDKRGCGGEGVGRGGCGENGN